MEIWLVILTIITIIVVIFACIDIILSFKKVDNEEKVIVSFAPIEEHKNSSSTTKNSSNNSTFSFKKLFNFSQTQSFTKPLSNKEITKEIQIKNELLKLRDSLEKTELMELKLNMIKGVGKRTINFMHSNNIDTLGDLIDLASISQKSREKIILGLPGLNFESSAIKHEKFSYFIKQAHEMVNDSLE